MVRKVPGRQHAAGHQEASARLTSTLADVSFPTTREALEEKIGDRRVPLESDVEISVREMLAHVREAEFKTLSRAQAALEAHWQAYRADKGLQQPPPGEFSDAGAPGR